MGGGATTAGGAAMGGGATIAGAAMGGGATGGGAAMAGGATTAGGTGGPAGLSVIAFIRICEGVSNGVAGPSCISGEARTVSSPTG